MGGRVTVVGDALLDVRVAPAGPLRPGADVPGRVGLATGGQGANIAVRLARRGARVRLVCALAGDAAGDLVRRALAPEAVELIPRTAPRTGAVLVLLDPGGDRTMVSQRAPLGAPGLDPSLLAATDWLVVSGYLLLEPSAAWSASGASPRRVVAGCALEPHQADAWLAAAAALAPHLVVLNRAEARVLAGVAAEAADLSRRLGRRLGATVVVTEPAGATAVLGGDTLRVAAVRHGPAVDTTGAGDAFTAGLVAELLDAPWPPPPASLEAAMRAAADLAAAVTRVAGAQGRIPGERDATVDR